jgi:hypothetical protein
MVPGTAGAGREPLTTGRSPSSGATLCTASPGAGGWGYLRDVAAVAAGIGIGAPAPGGAPAVAPDTAPGASFRKVRLCSSRLFELTQFCCRRGARKLIEQ